MPTTSFRDADILSFAIAVVSEGADGRSKQVGLLDLDCAEFTEQLKSGMCHSQLLAAVCNDSSRTRFSTIEVGQ